MRNARHDDLVDIAENRCERLTLLGAWSGKRPKISPADLREHGNCSTCSI